MLGPFAMLEVCSAAPICAGLLGVAAGRLKRTQGALLALTLWSAKRLLGTRVITLEKTVGHLLFPIRGVIVGLDPLVG